MTGNDPLGLNNSSVEEDRRLAALGEDAAPRKRKASLPTAIEAFLGLTFKEPDKPYRTQRDAREEAHRQVGFTQAQEALRGFLEQVPTAQAERLAAVRADGQLKPMKGPGGMNLWVPPEFPVKRR